VSSENVLESGPLPPNTSAQRAELIALTRMLELSEDQCVNIYTDSKYAFRVIHAHAVILKERGLLTSQGSPMKYGKEILSLSEEVRKQKEVTVMHHKAHLSGHTEMVRGNHKADEEAKRAASVEILGVLLPTKGIKLEMAKYSHKEDKLAEKLKCQKDTEGWWITSNKQYFITCSHDEKITTANS